MLKKLSLFFLVLCFSCLSGCGTAVYHQTQANVADVKLKIDESRQVADDYVKPEPSLRIDEGLYVDKTPISLQKEPRWLKSPIVIRGEDLPFSYYSRTIVGANSHIEDYKNSGSFYSGHCPQNVLTRYQVGLDPTVKLSINYSGDIKGALDLLAAKTGYVYSVNCNDVYWQAFVTKTFNIAFMPGTSDYLMGKTSGGGVSPVGGGGGGPGGGSQPVSAILDDSAASQYSTLKGTISVWDDLTNTIKQLLSPEGKVIVSQSTTSVTVRDKPSNVDLVARFIENMNNSLSSEVLIKVQVLDIQMNSDFDFGINWDVVKNVFKNQNFILNASYGVPITIAPILTGQIPQAGLERVGATGIGMLVNALKQQGKVSVVTEPRVVCMNNQVSAIKLTESKGYLASVQNTSLATSSSSGSTSITSQLTPGSVVFGTTIYLLPKILGDKVYLQVSVDMSNLVNIDQFGPNPSNSTTSNGTSNIQLPDVKQKQFNQRSMLMSGETLILSGFRQVQNQANAVQMLDSQTLGGRGSSQQNTETIVLITPIILHEGCA